MEKLPPKPMLSSYISRDFILGTVLNIRQKKSIIFYRFYLMMYKDAKIYVAGHTGLVGSAIVRKLQAE